LGNHLTNSASRLVPVRNVAEQRVLKDNGGQFILAVQDFLAEIQFKD
jgi:hypothetical protein